MQFLYYLKIYFIHYLLVCLSISVHACVCEVMADRDVCVLVCTHNHGVYFYNYRVTIKAI